ncbi:MAG: DoxX family protein [Ktedonobacteraceae bacterium]|nr:DoxX family protein [Ktedonobacteraceae bacterium]
MAIDTALLILRVFIGLLVAAHGAQKLFGWFGGNGFAGTAKWIESQGFRPATLWTLLAVLGEFGGGLLLALGLLGPLGVLGIVGAMLVAVVKVHGANGFWGTKGGYEYPLVLLVVSVVLGIAGPGSYSLDGLIGLALPEPLTYIIGLVVTLIIVGLGIAASNRRPVEQPAA